MNTPRKASKTKALLVPVVVVAVLAAGGGAYSYYQTHHMTIAAGLPLPKFPLLANSPAPVAGETGAELTSSDKPLPTTTSITLPQPAPMAASPATNPADAPATPAADTTQAAPAGFDATAARLGTTLSLLVNAWQGGGTLPRQLANAAADLAVQTGHPALANAAEVLRSSTPREGPITLQVLLLETTAVVKLTPPDNLPKNDTQAEQQKSWFRKQLEKLVVISEAPSTQNRWSTAIATVQQQLVRGAVTDAQATLTSAPLDADPRLDTLRTLTRGYLAQSGKLNNLITAYINTYLLTESR